MCHLPKPEYYSLISFSPNVAPTSVEILRPSDAVDVLGELLDAQNHSYILGLKLKLPPAEVEGIHATYVKPRERLLHVIIAFLNQVSPSPTWRSIINALNHPVVNLPHLACRLEATHFPHSTRDVAPVTSSGTSAGGVISIVS